MNPPGEDRAWTGEAKIAGRAVAVESGSSAHRFEIDIAEAVITSLNDSGDRLVVESWTPGRGYRIIDRE